MDQTGPWTERGETEMKKLTCLIMLLSLVVLAGGCVLHSTADEPIDAMGLANRDAGDPADLSAAQLEQMADSQYAQGEYELAFVNYNRALTLEPDDRDLLVKRGRVLAARNMDEQALKVFQDVLAEEPDHALANESAGEVYFESGLFDEAMDNFNRALAADPGMWRSLTYIGIIHDRQGNPTAALECFEKALSLNPGNVEILNNIGVARLMSGDNAGAQSAFRQAVSQGGADNRTYNNLGMALARMGRLHDALEAFRYGGDDATAHNNLGYVLLTQGRPREAIPYFQKAIELSPAYYEKAFENMKHARVLARNQLEEGGSHYVKPAYGAPVAIGKRSGPVVTVSGPGGATSGQSVKLAGSGDRLGAGEKAGQQTPAGASAVGAPEGAISSSISSSSQSSDQSSTSSSPTQTGQSAQGPEGGFYAIQVSSWRDEANASKHRDEIGKAGGKAEVVRLDTGEKGVWFKVVVGRYATRQEAEADRQQVAEQLGLGDARVTRVQESNLAAGGHEEASI